MTGVRDPVPKFRALPASLMKCGSLAAKDVVFKRPPGCALEGQVMVLPVGGEKAVLGLNDNGLTASSLFLEAPSQPNIGLV